MSTSEFACLGIQVLGRCAYNPGQPSLVYFSIGDAIAGLGFTLAVQQFFKPVYRFRLQAYGIRIWWLLALVFIGFLCAVAAALLPNLPVKHRGFFTYPVSWEIIGGGCVALAYLVMGFIALSPARVLKRNPLLFIRAGASLLSSADDQARTDFAADLLGRISNINTLLQIAHHLQIADWRFTNLEMERLHEAGLPRQFTGRPPVNAFYLFSHRQELDAAGHVVTFFQILADKDFCSVLVRKSAWRVAAMMSDLVENRVGRDAIEPFIQQIAAQAVINDESLMAKEVGFLGFGTVRLLSESLFSNWTILRTYDPLRLLMLSSPQELSAGYIERFNKASLMILNTTIKGKSYWDCQYMYSVKAIYEGLSREISFERARKISSKSLGNIYFGIRQLIESLNSGLEQLDPHYYNMLFITDSSPLRMDLVSILAETVYDFIEGISGGFEGFEDEAWSPAIGIISLIFPEHLHWAPAGVDPFQQQLALHLINKVRENMDGWYPAVTRLLLATIGPHDRKNPPTHRTANVILRNAFYRELKRFPLLYDKHPEKITHYLPANVTYDRKKNALTHTYRFGDKVVTRLGALKIPVIDLTQDDNLRKKTPPILALAAPA